MSDDRWISEDEAIRLIKNKIGCSLGGAGNMLKLARQSGEVRTIPPRLFFTDEGLIDFNARPGLPLPANTSLTATISEDDLVYWLKRSFHPVAVERELPTRTASTQEIRTTMLSVAQNPANDRPNVKQLAKLVVAQLRSAGAIASENQVITLADAPEFKTLRRPPGKTKRSGG